MHFMCCDQIHYAKSSFPDTDKNSCPSHECNISGTPPPTRQGHYLTKICFWPRIHLEMFSRLYSQPQALQVTVAQCHHTLYPLIAFLSEDFSYSLKSNQSIEITPISEEKLIPFC